MRLRGTISQFPQTGGSGGGTDDDFWIVHGTLTLAGAGVGTATFDWSGDVVFPDQPIPSWAVEDNVNQPYNAIYGFKIKSWVTSGGDYTGFVVRANQDQGETLTFHWTVEGFA